MPLSTEPVLTIASITALVSAVIALAVSFGLDLSGEQTTGILAVVAVIAPLVAGWFARAKVTPVTTARR